MVRGFKNVAVVYLHERTKRHYPMLCDPLTIAEGVPVVENGKARCRATVLHEEGFFDRSDALACIRQGVANVRVLDDYEIAWDGVLPHPTYLWIPEKQIPVIM